MENLWVRAEALLAQGKPFVLATIIRTRGSVPREIGAKMVVPQEGQPFGTIGGGCGEGLVLRRAYPLFDEKIGSRVVQVDLTGDFDQEDIQVCGGIMDVALDLWRPEEDAGVAHALAEATRTCRPAALVTTIRPAPGLPAGTKTCLALQPEGPTFTPALALDPATLQTFTDSMSAGKPRLLSLPADGEMFIDVQAGLQTLLIVGAGHIAQPLCEMGRMLGFRTVVLDDRRAFANRERFPQATEVRVGPFVETLETLDLDDHTFAVVVTRGHNWDESSLRTLLRKKLAYIGMIGSRRRAKLTLERLAADGYSPEALGRVHTPMGLDIGAQTPAEIALAIAAEIVRVRRHAAIETTSLAAKVRTTGTLRFTTGA